MAALGLATLSLAACDNARWVDEQLKKGATSSGSSGGASATGGASSEKPDTGGTGGSGGQPGCTSDVIGGEDVCTNAVALKEIAYAVCDKADLMLDDYSPVDSCGTDSYRFVQYVCCPKVEPSPPPPPPATPGCLTLSDGSPSSCKDAAAWKQVAYDACAGKGTTLTDYSPFEDCGDGNYRNVQYVCCPKVEPPPPPPPPSECMTQSQGDPKSCKSVEEWKQEANAACVSVGLVLNAYSNSVDCGDGNSRYVKYTCCPKDAPPASSAADR